jgi:hypothetical protein
MKPQDFTGRGGTEPQPAGFSPGGGNGQTQPAPVSGHPTGGPWETAPAASAPQTAERSAAPPGQPPIQAAPAYPFPPPNYAPPQAPPPNYAAPPQAARRDGAPPPPKGSPYAVIGTGGYIGMMLLFAIPVIGWLACIIMAFAAGNRNRRNFARATLVFLIVGIILCVALYLVFDWIWEVAQGYLQQTVHETTGGLGADSDGLNGLFGLFKGLDGLDIPAMPGQ